MVDVMFMLLVFVAAVASFVLTYFVPTHIARTRDHFHVKTIWTLNLLLGWTGIVWLALVIWSTNDDVHRECR